MLGESSRFSQQKQRFLAWTRDCLVSSMTSWLLRDKASVKRLDVWRGWGIGKRMRGERFACIWRTSRTLTPDPMDRHAQISGSLKLAAQK